MATDGAAKQITGRYLVERPTPRVVKKALTTGEKRLLYLPTTQKKNQKLNMKTEKLDKRQQLKPTSSQTRYAQHQFTTVGNENQQFTTGIKNIYKIDQI
jgi:hypothetical protein